MLPSDARWAPAALLTLALLPTLPACTQTAAKATLREAEALCLDERYEEAAPLLKALLLDDPFDAGAHYYLGRCFMLGDDFRPAMAVGEYQTAWRLFTEQGKESPIERFSADYFELICHVDSAKALLFQIERLLAFGVEIEMVEPLIERAKGFADKARETYPEAEEVAKLDALIRVLERNGSDQTRRSREQKGARS